MTKKDISNSLISSSKERFTLTKAERLTHKATFENIFTSGKSIKANCLRFLYVMKNEPLNPHDQPLQFAPIVAKRKFKKAVDRNRIKRLIRESWRKNKCSLKTTLQQSDQFMAVVILYLPSEIITYKEVEEAMQKGTQKLNDLCLE